jgi:phospholipase/carboxylesterase
MKHFLAVLLVVAFACGVRARPVTPPLAFVEKLLGGAKAGDALPLVIAIHGLGDNPERFSELYAGLDVAARLVAPRAPDPWTPGTSWFPIDDPERAAPSILQRAGLLVQLVDYLQANRKLRGLPIVTGFSQGGYMSYALAAYHSQRFAAALPIAGALPPPMPAFKKARPGFRVIAFHGEADRRVPFALGQRTAERLRKAGTNSAFTGYPGLAHGISPALERDYMAALREELDRLSSGPSGRASEP